MRGRNGVVGGALALALLVACGGSEKQAEEPVVEDDGEEEPVQEGEDYILPQEKIDAIQSFLNRQRKFIARCWGDALEAEEVPADADGKITINFTINPDGSVGNLEFSAMSHQSEALQSCVREKVGRWQITKLEKPTPYSFTFGFQRL